MVPPCPKSIGLSLTVAAMAGMSSRLTGLGRVLRVMGKIPAALLDRPCPSLRRLRPIFGKISTAVLAVLSPSPGRHPFLSGGVMNSGPASKVSVVNRRRQWPFSNPTPAVWPRQGIRATPRIAGSLPRAAIRDRMTVFSSCALGRLAHLFFQEVALVFAPYPP
jgi:hypothetical protein